MKVVIYESSSRGGNYKYAFALFEAYKANSKFSKVELLIPSNSHFYPEEGIHPKLFSDKVTDSGWRNKLTFIVRTLFSPLVLFFHLIGKTKTLVMFNDFEQSSAPFWTLLFRIFLRQHRYAVVLHDPNRDHYPPTPAYARFSMRKIMKLMDLALYHDYLPDKPYYRNTRAKYFSVPHGIYILPAPDEKLASGIKTFKGSSCLFAIIGNIRKEKNYHLAIEALKNLPEARVIIAGNPANSNVDVESLRKLAEEKGVQHRILWLIRYLSEPELASLIRMSDCILLNYAATFASQSGIINMIAPYKKGVIVSDTQSGMTKLVRRFSLGMIIQADDVNALEKAMEQSIQDPGHQRGGWENFLEYASWQHQVTLVTEAYEGL